MSSVHDDVMKMIQAKRDKIRNARRRVVRQQDVYNTIVDFIRDIERAIRISISFMDFDGHLNEAARKLDAGICKLDPAAQISVIWNDNNNMSEKWNELQVDHIKIIWGNSFVKKTGRNKEEVVDIGHLFLEGYFS